MAITITSPLNANISDSITSLSVTVGGVVREVLDVQLKVNGAVVAEILDAPSNTVVITINSTVLQAIYSAAKGSTRIGCVSISAFTRNTDGSNAVSITLSGGTLTINYRIKDLSLTKPLNSSVWNMDNVSGNLLSSNWTRTNSAFFARLKGYVNDVLVFNRYGFSTNSGTDVVSLGYKDAIISAMSGVSPASFRLDIVTQFDDGTADYEDLSYTASEVSGNYTRRSLSSTSAITNSFYTLSTIAINNCTLSDATNVIPFSLTTFGTYAHTVKLYLRIGAIDTLIRTESVAVGVSTGDFTIGSTERALIMNAMPTTSTATIWAEVTTSSYGSTNSQNVSNTVTLGASYKPTIGSVTWAEAMAYVKTALGYTTGTPFFLTAKSKVVFSVPVTNALGATTSYIRVQFAGTDKSQSSSPITTDFLITSGSLAGTIIVTDSRGRSSTLTTSLIVVRSYSYPIVGKFEVYRAASVSGAYDPLGTYLRSIVQGSAFSVKALDGTTEKNWVKYKIDYRIKNTGSYCNNTAVIPGGLSFGELTTTGVSGFMITNAYDVRVRVFDAFYDLDGDASLLEDTDDYAEGITILPFGEVSMMLGRKKMSVGKVHSGVGTVDLAEDTNGISLNADGNIQTNKQLKSMIASGTPPMVVASSTVVPNLNADKLDGYDANAFANVSHNHITSQITDILSGGVIASGSSGTDYWIKFADGTLIKYGTFSATYAVTTARGTNAFYTSADQTYTFRTDAGFPAFTTWPCVHLSFYNTGSNGYFSWGQILIYATTGFKWGICSTLSSASKTYGVYYYAIGRWN